MKIRHKIKAKQREHSSRCSAGHTGYAENIRKGTMYFKQRHQGGVNNDYRRVYKMSDYYRLFTMHIQALEKGHYGIEIEFLCLLLYRAPVDNGQYAAASARQKLQNAHSGFAEHKAVNAKASKEY